MSELKNCPFCGGEAELCYSEVDTFCRKCNVMQETELWNTRPIEDDLRKRIAELEALIERLIEAGRMMKQPETIEEFHRGRRDYDALVAELEAENDQLTAHDATERQDDKLPEREVCEACGGDGTLLLVDNYKGQATATVDCPYCNGTGRVNKECEK